MNRLSKANKTIDIAELDALPPDIRELILHKHYWAIHAEKLQKILLCSPRSMADAVIKPYPTDKDPNCVYHQFRHTLPRMSFWYSAHNLPIPGTIIKAREVQIAEFRRRYFAKNLEYLGKKIHVEITEILPHHTGRQKTDAEVLEEIVERDEDRIV